MISFRSFLSYFKIKLYINASQLSKMEKSIPDMSLQ